MSEIDTGAEEHDLRVAEDSDLAIVTINRPERRNALSRQLLAELATTLAAYERSDLRAVILRGAGDCFSAGADLDELDGTLDDLATDDAVAAVATAIRSLSVPVVAAIEGPCVGAAVELAMACDLRVASGSAYFRVPSVRLGILYRPGAIAALARSLPPPVLSRLIVFGDDLTADEAASLGVVAPPVVDRGGAHARALELTGALPRGRSEAARATKRLLVDLGDDKEDADRFEELRRTLATSPERAAALQAAKRRRRSSR